jgi:ribulose-bisphosphate carboxylase large chain
MISGERFSAVYRITGSENEALEKAKDICLEETVEFPEELVPKGMIRENVVGRIETFEPYQGSQTNQLGLESYRAVISFAIETTANEFTQLLTVLFGNLSLKPGFFLEEINLPPSILKLFQGPRFGRAGLRNWLGVPKRPLLFTALKPMGLSARELANTAYKLALGGIDIIKDDHGLTNQCFAPFEERVTLCAKAVEKANQETGYNCIYVANTTAPSNEVFLRAKLAKAAGARGLMVAPAIIGLDTMRQLAENDQIGLPIFSHPAFQGSYVIGQVSGISHHALFGQIARLAGADATIYPNFGGRFSFNREECEQIVRGTVVKMEHIRPIFPSPGGGMSLERVPDLLQIYGLDVIFLIGGGLFKHGPNLIENCRYFRQIVENYMAKGKIY